MHLAPPYKNFSPPTSFSWSANVAKRWFIEVFNALFGKMAPPFDGVPPQGGVSGAIRYATEAIPILAHCWKV